LQIIWNIEQYEYVELIDQIDSGVKVGNLKKCTISENRVDYFQVHLHAQYEIPSFASSGFGVSPGTHALASVTYSVVSIRSYTLFIV
jgi:hypothetical protein